MKKTLFLLPALLLAACATTPSDTAQDTTTTPPTPSKELVGSAEPVAMGSDMQIMQSTDSSTMTFVGGSSIVDHDGGFEDFSVKVTFEEGTPVKVESSVMVDSVYSDSDGLTGHLKRDDFFDAENFPKAHFFSTSVQPLGDDMYSITGNLTIKGTIKTLSFDARITQSDFAATINIPRSQFNVGNESYGDKLLDEMVPLTINATF